MSGGLRVARQEVRRLLPLALAMGVVTTALVWTHPSDWGTRWNSLGSYLREVVIVLGPACVVVGVWCGGAARRAGLGELLDSTRRSALARVAADVAALVVVLYAGVLLGWTSGAWTIVVVGGYGTWVAVWYLLGLLPAVAAYTAIGYAVGRLVPWRVAAPVAGLVAYVVLGYSVYTNPRVELAQGMGRLGGTEGAEFAGQLLVLSSLGLLALAVATVAASGAERRPAATRGWLPTTVVVALAAAVPFARVATMPRDFEVDRQARPAVACSTDSGPQVCVLREQRPLLAVGTRQARSVITRLAGVLGAPTHAGVDAGGRADLLVLPMTTTSITPWGHTDPGVASFLPGIGLYLDPGRYCPSYGVDGDFTLDGADPFAAGVGLVSQWLKDEPNPVDQDSPGLDRRFADASTDERRRFAGKLLQAVQACDGIGLRRASDVLPPLPDPGS